MQPKVNFTSSNISIAGSTFTTNRDQEAYYNQPAEPSEPVRNKPSRNYFPVNENYDDLDRNDFAEELPNPFVGEEQQVIAGNRKNYIFKKNTEISFFQ